MIQSSINSMVQSVGTALAVPKALSQQKKMETKLMDSSRADEAMQKMEEQKRSRVMQKSNLKSLKENFTSSNIENPSFRALYRGYNKNKTMTGGAE